MTAARVLTTTVDQYLAYDDAADCRTEFHDGEIFRIDDTSVEHGRLQANILHGLIERLGPADSCRAMGPVRYWVADRDFVNPDVSVICGAVEYTSDGRSATNPVLVFEVLSPSTADYDAGGKFRLYRQMRSLRQYVLVSQDQTLVELFTKSQSGDWVLTVHRGLGAEVPLESIGQMLPLADIYRGLDFSK